MWAEATSRTADLYFGRDIMASMESRRDIWPQLAMGLGLVFAVLTYTDSVLFPILGILGVLLATSALWPFRLPYVEDWLAQAPERWRAGRSKSKAEKRIRLGRSEHQDELTAWESFYVAASAAVHHIFESREGRMADEFSGPGFSAWLARAKESGEKLPPDLRQEALGRLARLRSTAESESPRVPAYPDSNRLLETCRSLSEWIGQIRIHRYRRLYRRLGLDEPNWKERVTRALTFDSVSRSGSSTWLSGSALPSCRSRSR